METGGTKGKEHTANQENHQARQWGWKEGRVWTGKTLTDVAPRKQKAEGREVILQNGGHDEELSVTPDPKGAPPRRGSRLGSPWTFKRRLGRALESIWPSGRGGGGGVSYSCLIFNFFGLCSGSRGPEDLCFSGFRELTGQLDLVSSIRAKNMPSSQIVAINMQKCQSAVDWGKITLHL